MGTNFGSDSANERENGCSLAKLQNGKNGHDWAEKHTEEPECITKQSVTTGVGEPQPPDFAKHSATTDVGETRPREITKYMATATGTEVAKSIGDARPSEVPSTVPRQMSVKLGLGRLQSTWPRLPVPQSQSLLAMVKPRLLGLQSTWQRQLALLVMLDR